jgi:uncharacterized protein (DUF427 family)
MWFAWRVRGGGMSILLRTALTSALNDLRHEPTAKRIRAEVGGRVVVDSTRAVLVWEPRRVVPVWAVPEHDIDATLSEAEPAPPPDPSSGHAMPDVSARPVLDPSIPFAVHTADGRPLDLAVDGRVLPGCAFRPDDPELDGYVALDFDAFESWWEEDVRVRGHPRDPFHRIDILPSSRNVRVELDGEVLAESSRPMLLFETMLPPRFYLPREDVHVDLAPTSTTSVCAYKGQASYFAATLRGDTVPDVAWTYVDPLPEANPIKGRIAFFDERVDVVLDGERLSRPTTPWSRRPSGGSGAG